MHDAEQTGRLSWAGFQIFVAAAAFVDRVARCFRSDDVDPVERKAFYFWF